MTCMHFNCTLYQLHILTCITSWARTRTMCEPLCYASISLIHTHTHIYIHIHLYIALSSRARAPVHAISLSLFPSLFLFLNEFKTVT
jgi:hypothetical protein